jgi:hypothetical protein
MDLYCRVQKYLCQIWVKNIVKNKFNNRVLILQVMESKSISFKQINLHRVHHN